MRFTNAYLECVIMASGPHPHVCQQFMRVIGMLVSSVHLLRPAFMLRVVRANPRGLVRIDPGVAPRLCADRRLTGKPSDDQAEPTR
jgi:hypothetical protein